MVNKRQQGLTIVTFACLRDRRL